MDLTKDALQALENAFISIVQNNSTIFIDTVITSKNDVNVITNALNVYIDGVKVAKKAVESAKQIIESE